MKVELNLNEVYQFMKDFKIDYLNNRDELIIDDNTDTYVSISDCRTIDEVKTWVVFAMSRPIGKGLQSKDAERLLKRLNDYFNVNLTRKDMRSIYIVLCYIGKVKEFEEFIKRGFPMEDLNNYA
ncbi:hypothetical protein ACI2JA_03620 [Alkalihalobacillus sp. NPDC078783]